MMDTSIMEETPRDVYNGRVMEEALLCHIVAYCNIQR